jgi:hypothetical protein
MEDSRRPWAVGLRVPNRDLFTEAYRGWTETHLSSK